MKKKKLAILLSLIITAELCAVGTGTQQVQAASWHTQIDRELEESELEAEQELDREEEEECQSTGISDEENFSAAASQKENVQNFETESQSGASDLGTQEESQNPNFSQGSEFGDGEDGFGDGGEDVLEDREQGEDFSQENTSDGFSDDTEEEEKNAQAGQKTSEAVLDVEEGEDLTEKLNNLLDEVKDIATDENPCKVIIPQGHYELTGTIHMYSNIHLYAQGAVITKTSTKKEIMLRLGDTQESAGGYDGYRNITIEGGTWDANCENTENKEASGGFVGFRIGHATNVTVKNVTFLNNLKSHFLELAGVNHAVVTGCTFRGYWKGYEGGGQECIQIDSCMPVIFPGYLPYDGSTCEDIVIKNNVFDDVFAGVGSHSMMFDRTYKNITISGNTFTNVKKRAIWCLNYENSIVENNVMKNVGGGIYVRSMYAKNSHLTEGQDASADDNQYAENITIRNNRIITARSSRINGALWRSFGIWVTGEKHNESSDSEIPAGTYVIRGVTVENNQISGYGHGVYMSLAEDCTFTGNEIRLSSTADLTNMGFAVRSSSNITLQNNKCSGAAGFGIYASGTTGAQKTHLFSGNTITGFASGGIWAENIAPGSSIIDNTVSRNKKNGICIRYVNKAKVTENYILYNEERGVLVQNSRAVKLEDNVISSNGLNGVELNLKSNNSLVTGNVIQSNGQAGLRIASSVGISVTENVLKKNKNYAIECKDAYIKKYTGNNLTNNGHSNEIYQKNTKIKL